MQQEAIRSKRLKACDLKWEWWLGTARVFIPPNSYRWLHVWKLQVTVIVTSPAPQPMAIHFSHMTTRCTHYCFTFVPIIHIEHMFVITLIRFLNFNINIYWDF